MRQKITIIEESGDAQMTNVFVLCFVFFNTITDAEKTSKILEELRYARFKNHYSEFHFNKESSQCKNLFFKSIQKSNFIIRYYHHTGNVKFNYIEHIEKSFIRYKEELHNSHIYIDGKISKRYRKIFLQTINNAMCSMKIPSVKFVNSKTNILIQLADMCAGCIRRKIERNTVDDSKLYDLIRKFIIDT